MNLELNHVTPCIIIKQFLGWLLLLQLPPNFGKIGGSKFFIIKIALIKKMEFQIFLNEKWLAPVERL